MDDVIVGDVVVRRTRGQVIGLRRDTGDEMWQIALESRGSAIAASADAVYLLTSANELACLDARTGSLRATVPLPGGTTWKAFSMYAVDGFVVIECVFEKVECGRCGGVTMAAGAGTVSGCRRLVVVTRRT
jgi:outer membrane protein assembly factor BamB